MKRYFRDNEGQFITAKEWFALNNNTYISCCDVDNSFRAAQTRLEQMLRFQEEYLSKIELALVSAAQLIVYQSDNPSIEIYSDGRVIVRGMAFSSSGMAYEPRILQRFRDVVQERIEQQRAIVARANATFVEVED